MRKVHQVILLAALVASTSAAQAQERGPRGAGRGAGAPTGAMLLGQKSVQEDLKLSEEQVKQVAEFSAKQRESFSGLRDASREERAKAFTESREAGQKAVATILNDEQRARLKQISLQLAGPAAFSDPEVAEKLGFSDEQKKSIEEIQSSNREEMRSLFQNADGNRAEAFRKVQSARKAAEEKLTGLLTDEQKTKWQELTGKKFEGRLEGPGGFGRGRRGGRDASLRRQAPAERDTAERDTTVLTADKSNEEKSTDKEVRKARPEGDKKHAGHTRGDKHKAHAKHAKHRRHGEHAARHHGRHSHTRHASHGRRHHDRKCEHGVARHRHSFGRPYPGPHFARHGHGPGHFGPRHHFASRHGGHPPRFGREFDARRQAWDRVARAMGARHGHRSFAHAGHRHPGHRGPHHFAHHHFAHRGHGAHHRGHFGPPHFAAHRSWRGEGQTFHIRTDRGGQHGERHGHHPRHLSGFNGPRGPHFAWHFDRHREGGPGFDRPQGEHRPPRMHPAGFKKRPHDAGERERSHRDGDREKHGAKRHGKGDRDHKSRDHQAKQKDASKDSEKRDDKQKED